METAPTCTPTCTPRRVHRAGMSQKWLNGGKIQPHAGVAQLVEHQLPKLRVAGSSPVARSEVRQSPVVSCGDGAFSMVKSRNVLGNQRQTLYSLSWRSQRLLTAAKVPEIAADPASLAVDATFTSFGHRSLPVLGSSSPSSVPGTLVGAPPEVLAPWCVTHG